MPTELKISFAEVRDKNVEQLKVLNRAIFPINYQARSMQEFGQVSSMHASRAYFGGKFGLLNLSRAVLS